MGRPVAQGLLDKASREATTVNRKLAYLTMVVAACGACAAACNSSSPAGSGGGSDARPDSGTPHDGNPTTDSGAVADTQPTTDGGATADTQPTTDGNPTTDGGGTDRVVTGPLAWAGIYDSDGVWDLSGPITAQRTIGDVVADLLIGEIVSRSGVPSALQGQAQSVVRSLVGDKIKAAVDAAVPASLKPGSDLMMKLATVLASTQVASTIDLYAGTPARVVKGDEELLTFKFQFQGRTSTLPARDLLDQTLPLVKLAAEWDGTHEPPDTLTINPHEFELRFGKLVLWVAENVLQEVGAASLATTAASLISCSTITSAITGGQPSFSFGVGFLSFSISTASLDAGCGVALGVVKEKALGLFDMDAGVELGGHVLQIDDNGDSAADRLRNKTDFGGIVTKSPGPAAIAPRVTARFEAVRRPGPAHPAP